jgi:hypothetical protein
MPMNKFHHIRFRHFVIAIRRLMVGAVMQIGRIIERKVLEQTHLNPWNTNRWWWKVNRGAHIKPSGHLLPFIKSHQSEKLEPKHLNTQKPNT